MLQDAPPSRLVAFTDLALWKAVEGGYEREVDPGMHWDELVLSWNVNLPSGAAISLAVRPEGAQRDYVMGHWSETPTSVKDQKDDFAKVDTDTLTLQNPGRRVTLRLAIQGAPNLKLLTASFLKKDVPQTSIGLPKVWGKILEPPRRAQMNYPNGNVICSATATSMVLGYWATKLERPDLDRPVPEVCTGVFDPGWGGTGNWSFNVAYAGSIPGIRAYVARLWDVNQLERWIDRGIPVVCSISYSYLKGEEKKRANDGHLVVLVGFDANGDPVFNDPGRNVVRMTYKRADFEKAWAHSGRTSYLIYPRNWRPPTNSEGAWLD